MLENALVDFVSCYDHVIDKLSFNFVSKEQLFKMNQKFLNHSNHTDIISFDYSQNNTLRAEFFISLWAVDVSSIEEGQTLENEVLRVVSHGVLHCIGFNDKNNQQKLEMRRNEDQFIDMFHVKHKRYV